MQLSDNKTPYMPKNMPHLMMWFGGKIPPEAKAANGETYNYVDIFKEQAETLAKDGAPLIFLYSKRLLGEYPEEALKTNKEIIDSIPNCFAVDYDALQAAIPDGKSFNVDTEWKLNPSDAHSYAAKPDAEKFTYKDIKTELDKCIKTYKVEGNPPLQDNNMVPRFGIGNIVDIARLVALLNQDTLMDLAKSQNENKNSEWLSDSQGMLYHDFDVKIKDRIPKPQSDFLMVLKTTHERRFHNGAWRDVKNQRYENGAILARSNDSQFGNEALIRYLIMVNRKGGFDFYDPRFKCVYDNMTDIADSEGALYKKEAGAFERVIYDENHQTWVIDQKEEVKSQFDLNNIANQANLSNLQGNSFPKLLNGEDLAAQQKSSLSPQNNPKMVDGKGSCFSEIFTSSKQQNDGRGQ